MSGAWWQAGFLTWARRRGFAARTLKNFRKYLELYAAFLDLRALPDPREATRATIADFQAHLMVHRCQRGRPYSTSARIHVLAWLKRLYEYLLDEQKILTDPTAGLKLPRQGRRLPRSILSADEMRRLLLAPDVTTPAGLRDRALLELVYGTGLRFSEIVDLAVHDVDLEEQVLWVRQGKGRKDRVLPLGRWATHWLRRYLTASDAVRRRRGTERVFLASRADRISNEMLNLSLRTYVRQADIAKSVSIHTIRHTFATVLLQGGADIRKIQKLLGHSQLTTTEIYTHLDLADLRRVQARCHPREKRRGRIRGGTIKPR